MVEGNLFENLQTRGLIYQSSNPQKIRELINGQPMTFYWGTDATATSLHIGHLVPINLVRFLQKAGHKPIILMGGGTTLVGDPSGREKSRPILTEEEIVRNVLGIKKQLGRFLDFDDRANGATMVNNIDWLGELSLMRGYLRGFAQYYSVNEMLSRETWKDRLQKNLPISLLEFVYSTLQGIDFHYLYKNKKCLLQVEGSDQWTNILAGIDLLAKKEKVEAFGLTTPLLTHSNGKKMGKTGEGKTAWLDENLFSPYEMYQYLRNRSDDEVEMMLKLLTSLDLPEIARIMQQEPIARLERLAYEVTSLVHGLKKAQKAHDDSKSAFGGQAQKATDVPTIKVNRKAIEEDGVSLVDLLVENKMVFSKSEVRRLIEGGGVRLNNQKVESTDYLVSESDFKNNLVVLEIGKKRIIKIVLADK